MQGAATNQVIVPTQLVETVKTSDPSAAKDFISPFDLFD
jgi:hypothetical protein